jgi:hypothetical protein
MNDCLGLRLRDFDHFASGGVHLTHAVLYL